MRGRARGTSNDADLDRAAFQAAVRNSSPTLGPVHHLDRGGSHAGTEYRAKLDRLGSVASLRRKGDCWDIAVPESFFNTLVHELLDHSPLNRHGHAHTERAVGDSVDHLCNLGRRHSTIDFVSPIEFELRCPSSASAAKSRCPRKRGKHSSGRGRRHRRIGS